MKHIYKLTTRDGAETYYSSLAAIWKYNAREILGVTYKQVQRSGVPYSNKHVGITRHDVRSCEQFRSELQAAAEAVGVTEPLPF